MSNAGFIDYVAMPGESFDAIALSAYDDEKLASLIIDANPQYCDALIFEGGEKLLLPVVDLAEVQSAAALPPWRRPQ